LPRRHSSYHEAVIAILDEALISLLLIFFIIIFLKKINIIDKIPIWLSIVVVPIFILFLIIIYLIIKSQLRPPAVGQEALIGLKGKVVQKLNPEGFVLIEGEIWRAVSATGKSIDEGTIVVVRDVRGTTLIVEEESSSVPMQE